jgi:hypothetical protein
MAALKIGKSVGKRRIEMFILQAELSKLAGVSPAHLGRIDRNGHDPHLPTLRRLPGRSAPILMSSLTKSGVPPFRKRASKPRSRIALART